eukprot:CAMPEP_0114493614 /NCGR_PEP_ID=MMETSP0109-20121206/4202_1 /TAXON_ID=29199 /ORGANISM="Chlorarachnion reptans, Strain CCCM449" /LENGTH=571 /DNA_ID=CAMNT_0001670575 /DNA_START=313 /DNA_END=2028 /DNA_ORIENTATION=+
MRMMRRRRRRRTANLFSALSLQSQSVIQEFLSLGELFALKAVSRGWFREAGRSIRNRSHAFLIIGPVHAGGIVRPAAVDAARVRVLSRRACAADAEASGGGKAPSRTGANRVMEALDFYRGFVARLPSEHRSGVLFVGAQNQALADRLFRRLRGPPPSPPPPLRVSPHCVPIPYSSSIEEAVDSLVQLTMAGEVEDLKVSSDDPFMALRPFPGLNFQQHAESETEMKVSYRPGRIRPRELNERVGSLVDRLEQKIEAVLRVRFGERREGGIGAEAKGASKGKGKGKGAGAKAKAVAAAGGPDGELAMLTMKTKIRREKAEFIAACDVKAWEEAWQRPLLLLQPHSRQPKSTYQELDSRNWRRFCVGTDPSGQEVFMKHGEFRYYLQHRRRKGWDRWPPLYVAMSSPMRFIGEALPEAFPENAIAKRSDDMALMEEMKAAFRHQVVEEVRNCYWFLWGPPGSGSTFHEEPHKTCVFVTLLEGEKRWIVIPPSERKAIDALQDKPFEDVLRYLHHCSDVRYMDFVQRKSDIVYIPEGWFHGVTNVRESIACAENMVPPSVDKKEWIKAVAAQR